MDDNQTSLRVELLGGFAIIDNDRRIVEPSRKSSKVWRLIEYLVAHRDRPVPQEELLDVFCNEESKDNPGSVLRTMVYRARTMLAEGGLECAGEIIAVKGGCYSWNSNIECITDTAEMEEYARLAGTCSDEDEKLSLLLKAAELYKGDFLQGSGGDMWVIPLVRWYRNLYIKTVREALELLMERGRIAEAEALSTKALGIDPFDEFFIMSYLKTLITQDKHTEAHEVYRKMETMFFDELGIDFSDELRELYKEIRQGDEKEDASLQEVVTNWLADMDTRHIYRCDPSIFRRLCQVEARSAVRSGHTAYVLRFNTKHDPHSKDVVKGNGVMKNLECAISKCLRASDIFTRYSPNQYMILLRSLTYEDCKMLISKILGKVDAKYLPLIIDTSIMHITANGEYVVDSGEMAV